MTIHSNITELIRRAPLVKLDRVAGGNMTIIAKFEFYNPANSVKDRIGAIIIEAAEAPGGLKPGGTIVEGTSGSIGTALAMVDAARGYKVVPAMPEAVFLECWAPLRAYGTKLVLTPGPLGMKGAVAKAEEVVGECGGALARQLTNPANLTVYRCTTVEEIWTSADDKADIFMAGAGTGGTVSGVSRVFKEHKPEVKITAVEPAESSIPSGGQSGPHKIQGLGANFVPEILNRGATDEVITRNIGQSTELVWVAVAQEGLLVGISSGTALSAAVGVINRPENVGKTIVAVLPDFGERYLFTVPFEGLVDA